MTRDQRPAICIVGAGPRGTSMVERISASLANHYPAGELVIHIIDPYPAGSGRVWRPRQPRELVMNTLAGSVTHFTDASVACSGPRLEGPDLYQWCQLVLESHAAREVEPDVSGISAGARKAFTQGDINPGLLDDDRFLQEIASIEPWSHPSRALYGFYLSWCFDRAVANLPERVSVVRHEAVATSVTETTGGRQRVALANGTEVECDAAVLALGWLNCHGSPRDLRLREEAEEHNLTWIAPAAPADQDLERLGAGEHVIVRGLGMGFFDAMALVTIDRGGVFNRSSEGLGYQPSGREPLIYVSSRRGVPFRSKSLYGSLPPAARQPFLAAAELEPREGRLDFTRDVLPLIEKDAIWEYYTTLERTKPEAFSASSAHINDVLASNDARSPEVAEAVALAVPVAGDRLDLDALENPAAGAFDSPSEFDRFIVDYISHDLAEARLGTNSALKAAAWSISAARARVAPLAAFGGFDGGSFTGSYQDFLSFGGMLGSGPPAFRLEQLLALMREGLVHFIGPDVRVSVDADAGLFVAESPRVTGSRIEASALLDAWMHMPSVRSTADPLLLSLVSNGRARAFEITSEHEPPVATGGVEIDPTTSRVVRSDGTPDPALFLAGIPTEDVRGFTIISPMPNSNSPMLRETDSIAVEALGLVAARAAAMELAS